MLIDKKTMRKVFILIAACIAFGWLLLDTSRATAFFRYIWGLISPFVLGAGIAFIFNVPMRAIENQLEGMRKPGLRRTIAILLTIFALVLWNCWFPRSRSRWRPCQNGSRLFWNPRPVS